MGIGKIGCLGVAGVAGAQLLSDKSKTVDKKTNNKWAADSGSTPPPPPDIHQPLMDEHRRKEKIKEKTEEIERLINSDGITEWASDDEVRRAAEILAELDPEIANGVVEELKSDNKLDTFAKEVCGRGIGSGLTFDQRQELFSALTQKLDAQNLVEVYKAFSGEKYTNELTDALINKASPDQQIDFIKAAASQGLITKDSTFAEQIGRMLEAPNPLEQRDGLQPNVARDNAWYEKAFGALDSKSLVAILDTATLDPLNGGMHGDSFAYDMTGKAARILQSANRVENPDIRKKVFEATAEQLGRVGSETDFLHESSGSQGGRRPVMEAAARLLSPADAKLQNLSETERGQVVTNNLWNNFRTDPEFCKAYDLFAKETVRTDNQDVLNPLLKDVQNFALPVDGKGGDERGSHLLGEILGRQVRAAQTLNDEGNNSVGIALSALGGEGVALAAGGPEGAIAGVITESIIQKLYPQSTNSSDLSATDHAPEGLSPHVQKLRNEFKQGFLEGKDPDLALL